MIFQKRAKLNIAANFHIDNEPVEIVRNYTHLRTFISSTGNVSLALDKLKEKALHALFSLRKHTNLGKLSPFLVSKIFEAMISPILTYSSEVWGAYSKSNLKSWDNTHIEKSHLQFCKRYLEVSNKASPVPCRAELGRFPLIIAINQKIMNYSSYLLRKGYCSIVKQIFLMSQDLHHAGENSYYSNIIRCLNIMISLVLILLTKLTLKSNIASLMQQKYILYWEHTMQNSTKLKFFNTFKNDYAPSSYLGLTNKLSERKELVKLWIGNHKLLIETGRYDQIPRVNRLSPICASNEIEDESHFLIYCNKNSIVRIKFYKKK